MSASIDRLILVWSDLAMAARLFRDAPARLRRPLSAEDVITRTRERMGTREARFLRMVDRTIYGWRRSPYRALLRHAGCEPGDLRALVATEGIEGALSVLASRGVYVTFDETKGRREIVRGSLRLAVRTTDFDNPVVKPHLLMLTSGSGGQPGRVYRSLALSEDMGVSYRLCGLAHGMRTPELACWWPSTAPTMIALALAGIPSAVWFYPVHPLPTWAHLGALLGRVVGRLGGWNFPLPSRGDLESPGVVVDALLDRLGEGREVLLHTMPSAAARLSTEVLRTGRRLDGLLVAAIGEPMTAARRAAIEASGARVATLFGMVECPAIAMSCPCGDWPDDVHVLEDRFAIVEHRREFAPSVPVDTLLLTSLDVYSAKIVLNTETGDTARLDRRDCRCQFHELGMRTRLRDIRSFEKLTSEGVTFARSRVEEILERDLPARFGGTALDYQLAEEEAPTGMTGLVLRVHPSVGLVDEDRLRESLLGALASESVAASYHAAIWRNAGTVEVRREPPRATRAGKVLPLQALAHPGQ
jgi:hypothetical protein